MILERLLYFFCLMFIASSVLLCLVLLVLLAEYFNRSKQLNIISLPRCIKFSHCNDQDDPLELNNLCSLVLGWFSHLALSLKIWSSFEMHKWKLIYKVKHTY